MTPEELTEWRKKYGHLSMPTMDAAANLRLSSCDASLPLGPLFTKKEKGDCVYFILTNEFSEYPLESLCILTCTPDVVLCEFRKAGEPSDAALMDNSCVSFLEHLRTMGFRALNSEEFEALTSGGSS